MAGCLNRAEIIGFLGRDPEIRYAQDGQKIASLSVATSERWTDKQSGEKREATEWHRVSVFSEQAIEFAEKFLRKGSRVFVEGRLRTRKWTGQDGVDRYSTEIVVPKMAGKVLGLDRFEDGGSPDHGMPPPDLDDEIPF